MSFPSHNLVTSWLQTSFQLLLTAELHTNNAFTTFLLRMHEWQSKAREAQQEANKALREAHQAVRAMAAAPGSQSPVVSFFVGGTPDSVQMIARRPPAHPSVKRKVARNFLLRLSAACCCRWY